jgi:molecular chaperone HtpG
MDMEQRVGRVHRFGSRRSIIVDTVVVKNSREEYEGKWDDIKMFIQYGMLSDDKFNERAPKFNLFKNLNGKYYTADELQEQLKPAQTDKNNQLIVLYTSNEKEQHSFIEAATSRGYEVMLMDSPLDAHLMNMLEGKLENTRFVRVDSDTVDKLIQKDEPVISKLSDEEQENLKKLMEEKVEKNYHVQLEAMSETDMPLMVTRPEFMRRMKEMSAMGGGNPFMKDMPESLNLVVNTNHPLAGRILQEAEGEKQAQLIRQATDLALLAQNLLKGDELTRFIKRSVAFID